MGCWIDRITLVQQVGSPVVVGMHVNIVVMVMVMY